MALTAMENDGVVAQESRSQMNRPPTVDAHKSVWLSEHTDNAKKALWMSFGNESQITSTLSSSASTAVPVSRSHA